MTLTEFLNAQIAEDEAVALTASADLDPTWWEKSEHARVYAGDWDWVVQGGEIEAGLNLRRDPLAHIARHDPGRVLAECAVKRAIVALHSSEQGVRYGYCEQCWDGNMPLPYPCPTLRMLAEPYDDHPDYNTEWRPMT